MRLWTVFAAATIAIGVAGGFQNTADARSGISPGRILGAVTSPFRHALRASRAHMRVLRHRRAREVARPAEPRPETAPVAVTGAAAAGAAVAGIAAAGPTAEPKAATDTAAITFWPHAPNDIFSFAFEPNVAGERAEPRGTATIGGGVFPASVRTAAGSDAGDLCGSAATPDIAIGMVERIEFAVQPTGPQRDLLKPLRSTLTNAIAEMMETCKSVTSATAPARLDAMRERIGALKGAVVSVRMPLEQFYNSLTDEQKLRIDSAEDAARASSFLRQCRQALADADWPARQIEQAVRPTSEQREGFERLRTTARAMAKYLAPSCPRTAPATVVGRLDAAADWLDAMLYAVIAVGPELQNFYDSLDDVQKERFNTIAHRPARGRS